jgi:hypothetical protein
MSAISLSSEARTSVSLRKTCLTIRTFPGQRLYRQFAADDGGLPKLDMRRHHPLIVPAMSPLMICFCATMKKITAGSRVRVMKARMLGPFQSLGPGSSGYRAVIDRADPSKEPRHPLLVEDLVGTRRRDVSERRLVEQCKLGVCPRYSCPIFSDIRAEFPRGAGPRRPDHRSRGRTATAATLRPCWSLSRSGSLLKSGIAPATFPGSYGWEADSARPAATDPDADVHRGC